MQYDIILPHRDHSLMMHLIVARSKKSDHLCPMKPDLQIEQSDQILVSDDKNTASLVDDAR
jgi:hypothetical protein